MVSDSIKLWQVNSFTDTNEDSLALGNPAGVVILNHDISENQKQDLAAKAKFSETAFVLKEEGGYQIRWFTPQCEVLLCGHATLAAAHILWSNGYCEEDNIRFSSKSGALTAEKTQHGIRLGFPIQADTPRDDYVSRLSQILNHPVLYAGVNVETAVALVADENAVRLIHPDMAKLRELPENGLIVTATAGQTDADYVYRAFFPKEGIDEDPVTGSANTLLGPFWQQRLNKNALRAFQVSAQGGRLLVEPKDNRVNITGQALTVRDNNYSLNYPWP